jgi:rare lipoprotein A
MPATVQTPTHVSPALSRGVLVLLAVLVLLLVSSGCATKAGNGPPTVRNPAVPSSGIPKAYNRPDTVKGQRYYPMASAKHYAEDGLASWYGWESGTRTAMGRPFDPRGLTAAHRTLPLPTKVRVTNLDNHRSVVVIVNDRGPFVQGRLIDLSHGAAQKIGMIGTGTARVKVVALDADGPAP